MERKTVTPNEAPAEAFRLCNGGGKVEFGECDCGCRKTPAPNEQPAPSWESLFSLPSKRGR